MVQQSLSKLGIVYALGLAFAAAGCGNTNKIWGKNDGAGDTDFIEAQAAYDAGNFWTAETLTTKLLQTNPYDERAAVLRGFTHLSEGGIDPFVLARELIAITNTNSSGSTTTTSLKLFSPTGKVQPEFDTTTEQDSGTGTGTAASSAANLLTKLNVLVSLSASDSAAMIAHTFGPADVSTSTTSLSLFTGTNTLVVPNDVSNALRASVEVLDHMNRAIDDVCPFVDPDVILAEDQRTSCTATSYPRTMTDQAHFLWAFSHLVEAVAFQTVLLYIAPGNSQPSIDAVNMQLNSLTSITSVTGLQNLVSDVQEVSAAISKVFNTTDTSSMIEATLADLNITVIAFGKLAGMPASIESSITSAFSDITSASQTVAGGTSVLNNAKSFKTQLTTTLAQTISGKIQTAASSATTTQKQQMCSAYSSLITDAPAGSTLASSTPAACSGVALK